MRRLKSILFIYGLLFIIGHSNAAEVAVIPSNQTIIPGSTFHINVSIDPQGTAIAGAQINIGFDNSLIRVNNVTEGELFKQSGSITFFNSGIINNSLGTVSNIIDAIIGRKNVSTQGTFITINATAVGISGISSIALSNIKVSDPDGNPVSFNTINGSVKINSPPLFAASGNRIVYEGQMITFTVSATDPDGDSIAYSAVDLPAGASFNPETRDFQWMPDYTQSGNYSMRFEVTDGIYTVQESIEIIVIDVNRPPQITTTLNNFAITNITTANGKNYGLDTLSIGKLQYIDRNYTFTSIPSSYIDLKYIRTANNDKNESINSFLEFDVNSYITVYVAHDDRISPKPLWLSAFSDTGNDLRAEMNPLPMSIYAKTYSSGHIILGGNAGKAGSSMYNVLFSQNNSIFNETDTIQASIMANDPDGDSLSYLIKIDGSIVSTSSNYTWITDYSSSGYHDIELSVTDGIELVHKKFSIYINNVYPRYDVDENGIVDIVDLVLIGQQLNKITGEPDPRYDVNRDGAVDVLDITITAQHFGENS